MIHFIFDSGLKKKELQSIRDRLKNLSDNISSSQDTSEIKSKIESDVPELNSIISILPKTRDQLYIFIGLIITALSFGIDNFKTKEPITPQTIINNYYYQPQSQFNLNTLNITNRKIGRNERCFCDSGKKYKHCHGKFISRDSL